MYCFLRLFNLRALTCLTFAGMAFLPLSEAYAVNADDADALGLGEIIDLSLQNNLGLILSRYATVNAQDAIIEEEASFDPEVFGFLNRREQQAAASSSALDSASSPASTSRDFGVGVSKGLTTGGSITLDTDLSRSSSNNNAARNPDYGSSVGVSFTQPLLQDAWSRINLAPLMRARVTAEASIYTLRSNVMDVILEAELAYLNLAHAQAREALIKSSVDLAKTLLEENIERERLGLVTPLEVLQAETELVNRQEDNIEVERAINDAMDSLRRVMGTVSFMDVLESDLRVSPMPAITDALRSIDLVVRDTILQDTDAKAQERVIEVQRINRMLAQDQTRPQLDLRGRLDYLGRDGDGESAFTGAYRGDGYLWNLGLEVRLPWGFREAQSRLRQAERTVEREKIRLYDLKQAKALAARNAWRAAHAGLKRVEVTYKAMRLNEQTFEQQRARYGAGVLPYRSVLEAQRDYDRAQSSYLTAQVEVLRAIARLSRVDGTLLERNGFTWDLMDRLALVTPEVENHPILNEINQE